MTAAPSVIVTGCGRSGSQWLAHVLRAVLGDAVAHEPADCEEPLAAVIDPRLRWRATDLSRAGHRVIHLVRDGRDVVRSLYAWHAAHVPESFETCCEQWAESVAVMRGFPVIRLRDLTARQDPSSVYRIGHWREWDADTADVFWRICGPAMELMGYGGREATIQELQAEIQALRARLDAMTHD